MASLVPCTACRRHVRRHETQCRFCGAALVPSASGRDVVIPRDAKRATIFALGLTIAGQACGGVTDVPDQDKGAGGGIFGAPPTPGLGGSGGGGGSGAVNSGGAGNAGGGANIQPVYGAVVPPIAAAGNSGSSGMPDATAPLDAGDGDSGSDAGG
jgi:hypothetical protein